MKDSNSKEAYLFEKKMVDKHMRDAPVFNVSRNVTLKRYCITEKSFQEVKDRCLWMCIPSTGGVSFLPMVMVALSS